ncbi:formimidoylglutamase [Vibrio mediterranei]|uniref:formimidoylglutamase n=1 Tax=Vibrio mediterranei TaxID=689 RepID=UPI001EFCD490|nr:formimidoylglutamase [Vibrio mediterranei]MCG9627016.1 formimidoylglutamase [Vibrio mediterranei]
MSPKAINTQHSFTWSGRDDLEDGEKRLRVHHVITQIHELMSDTCGAQLLGFETDEGVSRNKGRVGAKAAPDAIRGALSNLAWHSETKILDLGNSGSHNTSLEQNQSTTAEIITNALSHGPVVVLGGGHEIAWPSFLGLSNYLRQSEPNPRIGIINFDAHFDLREYQSETVPLKPSSGTPFSQIADHCQSEQLAFEYLCIGISSTSNTQALFDKAQRLNVRYIEDTELLLTPHTPMLEELEQFIASVDYLYLTIDLDVFNAALAPGVSAPAAIGLSIEHFYPFFDAILQHNNKLLMADIAEYNPTYDIDNRTAKLAARLCWQMLTAMSKQQK